MSIETWLYSNFDPVVPYKDTDIRVNCPFCSTRVGAPDESYHLHVSLVKQACHCFRCDYSSSWVQLIMDTSGVSYKEAMDELKNDAITPLYLLRKMTVAHTSDVTTMPKEFTTITQALSMGGLPARSALMAKLYIIRRLKDKADWGLYMDKWGVWTNANGFGKLVFPVENGWWQCRYLHKNANTRYASCSLPKNGAIYNYAALEQEQVMIAEGIISAACLGVTAIALCGKQATPAQLERLGKADVNTYTICLDADANHSAMEMASQLVQYGKEVWIRQYASGDPADSGSDDWIQVKYNFISRVAMALETVQ